MDKKDRQNISEFDFHEHIEMYVGCSNVNKKNNRPNFASIKEKFMENSQDGTKMLSRARKI